MKTHFSLLLATSVLVAGTTFNVPASGHPPNNVIRVSDTNRVEVQVNPIIDDSDKCFKWLKQAPFSAIDALGNWHFHPAATVCYLNFSQRHNQ